MTGGLSRAYGAGPLHLVAVLGSFALALLAAAKWADDPLRLRYAVWFVGAALAHDLLLLPLYALADRALRPLLPRSLVNVVRVPALLSGLLLLLFAPVILQRSEGAYAAASGLDQDPYLVRWLLLTAALFAGSFLLHALRRRG